MGGGGHRDGNAVLLTPHLAGLEVPAGLVADISGIGHGEFKYELAGAPDGFSFFAPVTRERVRPGPSLNSGKAFLVIRQPAAKVETVKTPLFQRWFGSPASAPTPDQETTETLAQRGSAEAQFSLGLKYASGEGASLDYRRAEEWYLKAAGQNHALAHLNLGVMYASGQGQPADAVKSMVWIQKAAELGDASAQFRLGELNHRDVRTGVSPVGGQARIDAYKWYRLAADQGYRGAANACDAVNLNMTREEVVEATRRVADFNAQSEIRISAGE